jgi:hypothetical protein
MQAKMQTLLPPNPIRARNLDIAQRTHAERSLNLDSSPDSSPGSASDSDTPDTDGLATTFFNFSTGRLQMYSDEEQLLLLCDYTGRVTDWFEGLMQHPPVAVAGVVGAGDVSFQHCNQITTLQPVTTFLVEAKSLKLGKKNGTVKRLENVIALHGGVDSAHKACTSTLRQLTRRVVQLLPGTSKKNACFDRLDRALRAATESGLFLRRYRDDLGQSEFEALAELRSPVPGRIINFNNAAQRRDYLNTEVSVFLEPALANAEMYFHTLLRQQNVVERAELQRRLTDTPPHSPLVRAMTANAARTVRNDFGRVPPAEFIGTGIHGENIFPAPRQSYRFPRVERAMTAVADAAESAHNRFQSLRNMPVGDIIGLRDHSSPESSDRSSASLASALSSSQSSSSPASFASALSRAASSSNGRRSKKRAQSQEGRKSDRATLRVRAKSR